MKYSFIKPRTKHIIEGDTKFWFLFMATSISLLIGFSLFLGYKINDAEGKMKNSVFNQKRAQKSIERRAEDIKILKQQVGKAEDIYSSNEVVRDSIKNLFNLVPKEITLDSVKIEEKKLTIQGTTPSKDIYQIGLLAPLKALFSTNHTTFYMLNNGWFKFVSTSKIEDFEGEIE